jgi:hypothetical protein
MMGKRIIRRGRLRAQVDPKWYRAVDRLLQSDTYRPALEPVEAAMRRIVADGRRLWPVGSGVKRLKQERAQGGAAAVQAAQARTSHHSKDRFQVVHHVLDSGIEIAAENDAPYARYIVSWKTGLTQTQQEEVWKRARAERDAEIPKRRGARNELLRQWYAARADGRAGRGPEVGSFKAWLGGQGNPNAKILPIRAYIDRPKKSAVVHLLRRPLREETTTLLDQVGDRLRALSQEAFHG